MRDLIVLLLTLAFGLWVLRFLIGWFPRGVALRAVRNPGKSREPDPNNNCPYAERWYIESAPLFDGRPYSCSFVEFDERGDYLDFHQHRHAYQKIRELAEAKEPLVLVIFIHGWRNNCQSGNVASFNYFLSQLATAPNLVAAKCRVHGVYLSWRGAIFGNIISPDDEHYNTTAQHFTQPIVSLRYVARVKWLASLIETVGYWNRKSVPEHKFSGTSLSRTVFTCAHTAKRAEDSRVFLIGHSFGGLLVERTVQNSIIAELTDSWPWNDDNLPPKANPLPFDALLCVNSAAPSIYAKQFQSYLSAHRDAMRMHKVKGAGAPVFISVTSKGDWATGITHPAGNYLARFSPSLRRKYRADDYILDVPFGTLRPEIPQSYYYEHTPGHNPLLVNRFIEAVEDNKQESSGAKHADPANNSIFATNMTVPPRVNAGEFQFYTTRRRGGGRERWGIHMPPHSEYYKKWSIYCGKRPVTSRPVEHDSAYWIVRCPTNIIKDHNDIWSQQAMEMYAALYTIAAFLAK